MRISIGEKIRELRTKKGCTQEELASALGITGQAVSRWESGSGYPDLEMIPSIANFFQISIDMLFGYDTDRQKRVEEILADVTEMRQAEKPDHDRIVARLRNACAEFPGDEKLSFELADALYKMGCSIGLKCHTNKEDGYTYFETDANRDNAAMQESIHLFRRLASSAEDENIVRFSRQNLVYLYFFTGQFEEAEEMARTFPEMCISREMLLISASNGENRLRYSQKALLELLRYLESTMEAILFSRHITTYPGLSYKNKEDFREYSDMTIEKYRGLIRLYELIFDDGNMGENHQTVVGLYLRIAHRYHMLLKENLEYGREMCLDAILDCLDKALYHAKRYDALPEEYTYTSWLLDHVTERTEVGNKAPVAPKLPERWIFDPRGGLPQLLEGDPRWEKWLENVKES